MWLSNEEWVQKIMYLSLGSMWLKSNMAWWASQSILPLHTVHSLCCMTTVLEVLFWLPYSLQRLVILKFWRISEGCTICHMTLIVHQREALKYVKDDMESEAARHFQIPSATPRTWKGLELQPNNCKNSMNKKWKHVCKSTHSGCSLSCSEDIEVLKGHRFEHLRVGCRNFWSISHYLNDPDYIHLAEVASRSGEEIRVIHAEYDIDLSG